MQRVGLFSRGSNKDIDTVNNTPRNVLKYSMIMMKVICLVCHVDVKQRVTTTIRKWNGGNGGKTPRSLNVFFGWRQVFIRL